MSLRRWFGRVTEHLTVCARGQRKRTIKPGGRSSRLSVEQLGERIVPATTYWIGMGGNNNASNAGNWSNGVPGVGDTAIADGLNHVWPFPANPNNPIVFDAAFG